MGQSADQLSPLQIASIRPVSSLGELISAEDDDNTLIYRLAKAARSTPYQDKGDRLLPKIFQDEVSTMVATRWVVGRLRKGVSAATVSQDIAAARLSAQWHPPVFSQALNGHILNRALQGARRITGPPPLVKGATPMTTPEYEHLIVRGDLLCRQALALGWMRAARMADVLALRRGSLWLEGADLAIELGAEKAKQLGIPGFILVTLPVREKLLLLPLIAPCPPASAPLTRPPLLDLTYARFRTYLTTHRPPGSQVTPHSMRKGAVLKMLQAGQPLKNIALITQHRSALGLMAYVSRLDRQTRTRMESASAAIAGIMPRAS